MHTFDVESPTRGGWRRPLRRERGRTVALTVALAGALTAGLVTVVPPAGAVTSPTPFLAQLGPGVTVASTVPPNGDVNPYGVVTVPQSLGDLVAGDTLVSNFNASSNLQGTGTTVVQIAPTGRRAVFARLDGPLPGPCPGGVGLTTALTVLQGGYVVVGSLPVTDGGTGTPEAGCLIVLDRYGRPVETFSGGAINGPWDLTADQSPGSAQLFVTNVLNGTVAAAGSVVDEGTVVRLDVALPLGHAPVLLRSTVIATGFGEQLNQSALVLGPAGVGLAGDGTLYVADTVGNRIAAVAGAPWRTQPVTGGGPTLTSGGDLNAPLGLVLAPDGGILTVNGNDPDAVETSPDGTQVDVAQLDPLGNAGDLFGLTVAPDGRGLLFVDDGDNTLKVAPRSAPEPAR